MELKTIEAPDLARWLEDDSRSRPTLLDVRELPELRNCRIADSIHMSMHSVPVRLGELNQEMPIVCICHHGARSMQVARFLVQQGFQQVMNLSGGIHAWATQVDPEMETY